MIKEDIKLEAELGYQDKNRCYDERMFSLIATDKTCILECKRTGQKLEFHCIHEFIRFCGLLGDFGQELEEKKKEALKDFAEKLLGKAGIDIDDLLKRTFEK